MITTIQLSQDVKSLLTKLKKSNQTYEEVIVELYKQAEKCKKDNQQILKEAAKEMYNESLNITKDFEQIEDLENWEW